jgi:N-methylhydantoinase A
MRYRGQGHEIAVSVPGGLYTKGAAAALTEAFEAAYRRLYSRVIPGVEIEVLSWVVLVSAPVPQANGVVPDTPPPSTPEPARRREVFDTERGAFVEVAIYERASLAPGATLPGPAVIVEDETSTVVSRAFDARIDRFGYIELTRRPG